MHVYRCYDKDLNLLYIGSSLFYQNRVDALKSHKWFDGVVYIRLEKYKSKTKMLTAERNAIQAEKPKYNLMCTPHYGPHMDRLRALKNQTEALTGGKLKATKIKDGGKKA